jgi:uncharacterized membrane protein
MSGGPAAVQHGAVNVSAAERSLSLVGGAALAVFGVTRGTGLGMGLAVAGAAMIFRGLTGHCELYHALGMNTAQHDPSEEVAYRVG